MQITFTLMLIVVLCALPTQAGPEDLVKQRAKNVRDQNNAQQGVPGRTPPGQSTPSSPATAKPAPIKPTPAAKIKTDLMGWHAEKTVSAASRQTFTTDLLAAARGSKRPPKAAVEKLSASLATALGGKAIGTAELSRLTQNLNLAVNSAGLSQERLEEIATQFQTDLESTGASPEAAAAAAKDLKAVMAELSL